MPRAHHAPLLFPAVVGRVGGRESWLGGTPPQSCWAHPPGASGAQCCVDVGHPALCPPRSPRNSRPGCHSAPTQPGLCTGAGSPGAKRRPAQSDPADIWGAVVRGAGVQRVPGMPCGLGGRSLSPHREARAAGGPPGDHPRAERGSRPRRSRGSCWRRRLTPTPPRGPSGLAGAPGQYLDFARSGCSQSPRGCTPPSCRPILPAGEWAVGVGLQAPASFASL